MAGYGAGFRDPVGNGSRFASARLHAGFADQGERPAADREMPAIILDATHLMERVFIERGFELHSGPVFAKQAQSAVVTEHFRMHAGEVDGDIE